MIKLVSWICLFVLLVWFFLPVPIEKSATEIGFPPGGPDPNSYVTTYGIGYPLSWLKMDHIRNELNPPPNWQVRRPNLLQIGCLIAHLLLALVPAAILYEGFKIRNTLD